MIFESRALAPAPSSAPAAAAPLLELRGAANAFKDVLNDLQFETDDPFAADDARLGSSPVAVNAGPFDR